VSIIRTRLAVTAERAFLDFLGAGCRLPVGAYAEVDGERIRLRALLAGEAEIHRDEAIGVASEAEAIGQTLAERLLIPEAFEGRVPFPSLSMSQRARNSR
jgi:hydroxymethylbilane synthase